MNVFSIPTGLPFVDALADGLLARAGSDPLRLSAMTVLLPTRRAIRSLKEAFLRRIGDEGREGVLLLPRMMTLGDLDEDELLFQGRLEAQLPPAIDGLRRRLMLGRLIMAARSDVAWDQAVRLAAELGRFLDQMQTQGAPLERLKTLVPDDHAQHWGEVLKFLGLLEEAWPAILAEEQAIDPAERRKLLLEAQAKAWQESPPPGPVIAAGSTGSMPATAALLKAVATLAEGAVVLPGLDRHLDEAAWKDLDDSHPQFGLKKLLEGFGIERADVADWPSGVRSAVPAPRLRLISEAFRPAAHSDAWLKLQELPRQAAEGLFSLEAPDPRSEALAIALMLREAAEDPKRTAALVTPDRDLARRVAAELLRFGIEIDDSAGQPLAQTPPGVFLRLIGQAALDEFAPVPLLALLKHPLTALGMAPARLRHLARDLERAKLRGPRPSPGLGAIMAGHDWLALLEGLAAPFARLLREEAVAPGALLLEHVTLAEKLAASDQETGAARLWPGEAGEAAKLFLSRLMDAARGLPPMPGRAYPAFLEALMEDVPVRPAFGKHPRLHIWGPLEARLQQADLVILGGMNEGVWPADPPADPWLSRPMRQSLGLDSPERRVGMSAHDAVQAMGAGRVILTRSAKMDGAPTKPSRFWQRLETALSAAGLLEGAGPQGWRLDDPLDWAHEIDHAAKRPPIGPPAPCPPLEARPTGLSVTRIETWMRDPYALYAQKILGLDALKPVDADPSAADYGTLIHRALELYLKRWPLAAPADALGEIEKCGEEVFAEVIDRPGVWAFWWPRFQSIALFVARIESKRSAQTFRRFAECKGALDVDGFRLSATADRIELGKDGDLALVDYKTGTVPPWKQVEAGFAPQLPLEAAMLLAGAFEGVPRGEVSELAFWKLSGGRLGGERRDYSGDVGELAKEALEGLHGLIRAYRDPSSRYPACPTPGMAKDWSDYAHLERRLEWQSEEES